MSACSYCLSQHSFGLQLHVSKTPLLNFLDLLCSWFNDIVIPDPVVETAGEVTANATSPAVSTTQNIILDN